MKEFLSHLKRNISTAIGMFLALMISSSCSLVRFVLIPTVSTPTGSLTLTLIHDGNNYIEVALKGDGYIINADSMKLVTESSLYEVSYYVFKPQKSYQYEGGWPDEPRQIYNNYHLGNDTIYIGFETRRINRKNKDKKFEKSPVYKILPSDFILCNGIPVIRDTLTVQSPIIPIVHTSQIRR